VQLSILPRIGSDNTITMDLRPNVTFLKSMVTVNTGQGEVQLPTVSNRVFQSTLTMKSGETIAIGGLITSQDLANVTGFPLLMNLPVLGQLFRQTTKSRDTSELVIFITAREIDGPASGARTKLPIQSDHQLPTEFTK
jgi:general secretion pathway protein D